MLRSGLIARLTLLATASSLAGFVSAARSAEAPAAAGPVESVGELIVTASKREERLRDVPMSVTAVSGAELAAKGVYDVKDLVKLTPGLSYVDSGRGVPVFSLRGVGYFDQSLGSRPTVSVYIDQAPIPFSIEAKGAAFDLDRVEVLKGPQGTLFGQNATGGAINYVAAKPTSELAAGAIGSYGTFNTADVQGFVSGPLTSTLNGRLAIRTLQSGDWQKSYTRSDTLGAQDFTQARLLLDWTPTDRLKVAVNANGFYDGSDTQAAQFLGVRAPKATIPLLNTYPIAPSNPRAADWNPGGDYVSHNTFYQASVRADYDLGKDAALTSLTAYSHERIHQRTDGDGTALTNYDGPVSGQLSSFTEELRVSGTRGDLKYIAGAYYENSQTREMQGIIDPYSSTNFTISLNGPFNDAIAVRNSQRFDTKAIFGNLDYSASDRIILHGGLRYTDADLHYTGCTFGLDASTAAVFNIIDNRSRASAGLPPLAAFAPGECVSLDANRQPSSGAGRLHQDNVSWRTGVDFKITPDALLYVNVSKGYKGGSGTAPAAQSASQFAPVSQESVVAYEAGAKASLLDRRLEASGAVFYYDYTDKQLLGRIVFTPNIFGALSSLLNVPKSRVEGAEFQVSAFPIEGLTLSASGTYLDTRVITNLSNFDVIGNPINLKDEPFPYTPRWQLVFDGEYKFPVSDQLRGVVAGNASYRSRTTAGFGGDPRLNIASYWLVDLRAGLETADRKWGASLFGRNVTNQYYWTNVSSALDTVRRYAGKPATYGVQLSYRY